MATTIDELNVKITATQAGFEKEIASVKSQLNSLSSYTEKSASKMSTGMVAAGTAIGGILTRVFSAAASVISSSMGDAVARVDTLNNFANVMGNLGIDSDVATKSINYMSEALQGLPTTLDDAATSVQRLVAANGNLEASTQMYLALNNAMLAGGTAQETQSAAMEQLLQAYSKGRFEMEEWRSLLVAMPAQLNQIATAMGYVDANSLYNAMQSGEVSMNDFMATAVRLNTEGVSGFASFEQQARSATNGIATSITNLKTAIARALAAIMDVIGQSNIAGFFNTVAAAIRTAGNYIAAFVKVVLTAINALRALFGQEQITFGSTAKDTDNAADAVGSIGDAADGAAGSMDNASNSAKKLKKQLASFDEMNVLQQQETGSTGGSGGSGGGGGISGDTFDVEPFNTDGLTSATDKVEAIFQGMMDALNGMFDFTKIGNAIKRFANDVSAFLAPVGKIVGDLWYDYLKPFISWSGNSLLPAVLNAIGGALQFVGAVLGELWATYLKPFIDEFLVPIAQWTGGVIVSVLNGIGDGLRSMAKDEGAIRAVAEGIAAIAVAITAVKAQRMFSEFSKGIGIFEKAYSTGMSVASAFGVMANGTSGLIGKLAGLLSTGLNPLVSGTSAVSAGFSSLWAVISAHPIAAILTALAALLLTNEDLRDALGRLINAVLEPIGQLLGDFLGVLEPIISIIGNLVAVVGSLLSSALTPLAELLATVIDNGFTPLVDTLLKLNPILSPIITAFEFLLSVLEPLADALGWVADVLNEGISLFGGASNSANELGASEETLTETNDKLTTSAEAYNEALAEQKRAQEEAADVALALLNAQEKLAEKNAAVIEMAAQHSLAIDTNSESYRKLAENLASVGTNAERAQLINETYGTSLTENDPFVQEFTKSVLEQSSATQSVANAQQRVTENQQAGFETQEQMTQYLNEQIQALKDAGLSSDQMNEKLRQLTEDGSANSLALKDEIIKNASEFGLKWDETSQSMSAASEASRAETNDAYADIGEWFGAKFNEAKTNMENAFSGVGQWASDRWTDIQNGFNGVKDWFKEKFENAKSGIEEGLGNIGQWASDRFNDIKNGFSNAKETFKEIGGNILNGIGEGLGNMGEWLTNKFNGAVDAIKNFLGIHSPSRLFKEIGGYMGTGLSMGFDNGLNDLLDSTEDTTKKIVDGIQGLSDSANDFMSNQSAFDATLETGRMTNDISKTISVNLNDFDFTEALANAISQQITVNIGSKTIVDEVVEGINDRSFLNGRAVINV